MATRKTSARDDPEAIVQAEAGHAETAEHEAKSPGTVESAPDTSEQATMRPGATTAAVKPPERDPMPGSGPDDGRESSNPKTQDIVAVAPRQSVEDENEALRAEILRMRKVSGDAAEQKRGPSPPGFPRLVTANRTIYYNEQRYREGDTFAIHKPEDFSTKGSMEWAEPGTEKRQTTGKQELKKLHDDLLGVRSVTATGADKVLGE